MRLLWLTAPAALSLLLEGCGGMSKPDMRQRLALQGASTIRESLTRGDCAAIYARADSRFQSAKQKEDWLTACRNLVDSGPWSTVTSNKTIPLPGSKMFAVEESLQAPIGHTRVLFTLWQFEGQLAKLSSLAFREDNVTVAQAPKGSGLIKLARHFLPHHPLTPPPLLTVAAR